MYNIYIECTLLYTKFVLAYQSLIRSLSDYNVPDNPSYWVYPTVRVRNLIVDVLGYGSVVVNVVNMKSSE